MQISLNHLRPGMAARVVVVLDCEGVSDRLQAFGIQPGTRVHCCERSKNGQVTALQINDMCIRLRTRDLEKIRVEI